MPRWVLRNIFEPRGEKLPKRKILEVGDAKKVWEPTNYPVSSYDGRRYWERTHTPAGFIDTGRGLVRVTPFTTRKIGNLNENDYAFWIGVPNCDATSAVCRYCRT